MMQMKLRLPYIYLLLGAILFCSPAYAAQQKKKTTGKDKSGQVYTTDRRRVHDIHHIAVWGGVGYSGLVNNYPAATSGLGYNGDFSNRFIGGGGGLIGFGYEYKYKHFLLSVGPEFRIFSSLDKMTFQSPYIETKLQDYGQYKYYQFNETLNEQQAIGQLMLPVMFGGTFDKVYFKAGAKVGYTLLRNYTQTGLLSTTIADPLAMDNWEEMPRHGLINNGEYESHGKNPFGLDIALSAEVGINLDQFMKKDWQKDNEKRDRPIRMRVAAFLDYGLWNINVHTNAPFAVAGRDDIASTSLHQSEWATSRLNSLLVGVKFTALLQMNKEKVLKKEKPLLIVYTEDAEKQTALSGVTLSVQQDGSKRRPSRKTTNNKGYATMRLAEGDYSIAATKAGYIPSPDNRFEHLEDKDTMVIPLTPVPVYTIYVRNAKTEQFIASTVRFIDVATGKTIQTATTDSLKGMYRIALPMNATYKVHVEADNFLAQTHQIASLSEVKDVRLEPIVKKRAIILNNLYFATNETTILPESEQVLNDLYEMLSDNPEVRIRIIGHTDAVGSDKDNQVLSERRANSVRQAMLDRGINAERIEAIGKGKSEPIATNDTEEGRQKNRRVEFVIL